MTKYTCNFMFTEGRWITLRDSSKAIVPNGGSFEQVKNLTVEASSPKHAKVIASKILTDLLCCRAIYIIDFKCELKEQQLKIAI